jgi:predicted dehydrogenase
VTVTASQSAAAAGNDLRIAFENGVVTARGLLGERAARVVEIADQEVRCLEYGDANLYRREVEDFCNTLSSSVPGPGTSADEALDAARILFAIEDAAVSGRFVELSGYSPQ